MFPLRVGSIHRRGTFQAEFSARRSTAIIVSQRWSPVGQHKAIPKFELRFMGNTVRLYTSKGNGALTTTRCVVRKEIPNIPNPSSFRRIKRIECSILEILPSTKVEWL
ncbi:hypothetical protein AVEN_76177-1 [Araneus ventricosus]|uniref:Uncharacterized protein n=1 Tax=Araneus ventricosus TaxID=182803 RepID=A0A4Y2F105_ARAVE|nr:hypothetical protein AVEN_76177-1 [Araneus ventricosus]